MKAASHAAQGFVAGGIHCGIRKNKSKRDLALIYSETPCAAAAVYTQNKVKGAPHSGHPEAHRRTAPPRRSSATPATPTPATPTVWRKPRPCAIWPRQALGIEPQDVVVASTGVIGQVLPMEPIQAGIPELAEILELPKTGHAAATEPS